MFTWGVTVFVALWLVLANVSAPLKAKLMGRALLVHLIVIGSSLAIQGGQQEQQRAQRKKRHADRGPPHKCAA